MCLRCAERHREEEAWQREVELRWVRRESEQEYKRLEGELELVSYCNAILFELGQF